MPQLSTSLPRLQERIRKLHAQADRARRAEVKGVIRRIKKAIDHYGITATELGYPGVDGARHGPRRATASKSHAARRPRAGAGVIRYRDAAGNEWTGHGRRPRWFLDALASGKTAEQLRVK